MMYMFHYPWFLGLIVGAAGFIVLHYARKEKSLPLGVAAWMLILGGLFSLFISGQGMMSSPHGLYWMNGFMPFSKNTVKR